MFHNDNLFFVLMQLFILTFACVQVECLPRIEMMENESGDQLRFRLHSDHFHHNSTQLNSRLNTVVAYIDDDEGEKTIFPFATQAVYFRNSILVTSHKRCAVMTGADFLLSYQSAN